MVIDDGSGPLQLFIPAHQSFDPARIHTGQMVKAEGMSAQYDSTYEVIITSGVEIEG